MIVQPALVLRHPRTQVCVCSINDENNLERKHWLDMAAVCRGADAIVLAVQDWRGTTKLIDDAIIAQAKRDMSGSVMGEEQ